MALFCVLAAALYVYRGAFRGFFVQDDYGWLDSSCFENLAEYLGCFVRFNPALTYRPLSQETFFLIGRHVFGMQPLGFHIISAIFYLTACGLVYAVLRFFFPIVPSAAGAAFFGVHGAHLRSVYWISALPEPMALVFYLGSFVLFVRFDRSGSRRDWLLSLLLMLAGIMSKESILSLPLTLAAYCLLFSRPRLPWTLPFFLVSGVYTILRLASDAVRAAPYPLTFGREAWQNLLAYCSWSAGFTETMLKVKLGLHAEVYYSVAAAGFAAAAAILWLRASDRRLAAFGLIWFAVALQPVLYFSQHIDSYYLAPSLAGFALFLAAAFPRRFALRAWRNWLPAAAALGFIFWAGATSVRLEGRWWNERSLIGKRLVELMPSVARQVPEGRIAYLFGLSELDLGILQNDSAFKAFGFDPGKYIIMGIDRDTPRQILQLEENRGLLEYYCFVYIRGQFVNVTPAFRRNPRRFLRPVGLEASKYEVSGGRDSLTLRILNLEARAIGIQYTLDGAARPPIAHWKVGEGGIITIFVDSGTPKGMYHYTAIRDAADPDPEAWYPVDVRIQVK